MAALGSDWLRHFRLLLWNRWTEFNETWQEARSERPLPSLCFSGRSEKQDGCPGLWLAETFSTSPLKPLNGIQWNLTESKISTSSTTFEFFGPIRKTWWGPWPLIGWDIFDFSSETTELNATKLDRKQDLNVLCQVCVFRADQQQYKPDFANDDCELSRRVWRSIETLFKGSGLRKNLRSKSGARPVYRYSISPNCLFCASARGGKSRKIGYYAKIRYGRGKDIALSRHHTMVSE